VTGPTFAVIGAARSGTTAITEALRRHPDAFVTTPKEPHYFAFAGQRPRFTGPGDDTGINRRAVTETSDYLALYDGAGSSRARGEGSVTSLYYFEPAIAAMRSLNPDLRLVVVLRDPVERAFSSFQYLRVRGRETEADFLTAVTQEESRRAAGWQHLWHYTAMSRYADSLEAFLGAFGRERLCVLLYDEVLGDFGSALNRVYLHLGLDPGLAPSGGAARVNTSGRTRSRLAQAALNRLGGRPLRRTARRLVPYQVRERVRRWNQQAVALTAQERAALSPLFTDDLQRVEQLLGVRLPDWGRSAGA
jgi:hypothetical protein